MNPPLGLVFLQVTLFELKLEQCLELQPQVLWALPPASQLSGHRSCAPLSIRGGFLLLKVRICHRWGRIQPSSLCNLGLDWSLFTASRTFPLVECRSEDQRRTSSNCKIIHLEHAAASEGAGWALARDVEKMKRGQEAKRVKFIFQPLSGRCINLRTGCESSVGGHSPAPSSQTLNITCRD